MQKTTFIFFVILTGLSQIQSAEPDSLTGLGIEDILIVGNEKTGERVILREMKSRIGTPYSASTLDKDLDRIRSLQLFSRVQSDVFQSGPDSVTIMITVNERWYIFPIPLLLRNEKSWKKWSFGLGVLHDNMHGLNHDLIASGWLGFNPGFDIKYSIPWFAGSLNLYANMNIYTLKIKSQNLHTTRDGLSRYNFHEHHRGVKGYLGKRWGHHFYTSVLYAFNHLEYPDEYQYLLPGSARSMNTISFGVSMTWDTRDLIQYPSSGCYLNASVSMTPWKDVDYSYAGTDMRAYLSWGDLTFAFRTAGKTSFGRVPVFSRTFLGYEERIRGHFTEQREGENRVLASAEIRFPIIPVRYISLRESDEILGHYSRDLPLGLNGTVFYDTGSVWMQDQAFFRSAFLTGFGIGLAARIPYAEVLRLEYALNTDHQDEWILDLGVAF
ncbi:MAG: BamA/TamA family outer membrane protein [candidate division KSB1 bacterium]|nr:BamA/TamA family outer membrane protein [candidate division KSB1 bacterium]